MSVATTDLDRAAAAEEQFRAVYEANFSFLASIATNKFRVPDTEAETLAHECEDYLRELTQNRQPLSREGLEMVMTTVRTAPDDSRAMGTGAPCRA